MNEKTEVVNKISIKCIPGWGFTKYQSELMNIMPLQYQIMAKVVTISFDVWNEYCL